MPPLLRRDTIRLLEASIESLQLAITGLGASKRIEFRQPTAEYAIEIGLIGAAAELAMSACLVQALGCSAILWPSGQYKTAGQILDDFRRLIREATINSDFLVQGIVNPAEHRAALINHTIPFRRLFPVRASGLHAGRGLFHEATVVQAGLVADFLEMLGKSSRINPYLEKIPRCRWYTNDRTLIIEDINRRLQQARGEEIAIALSSLYLVLPDIPNEEPEWIQALERVAASPRDRDITYLMDALQMAVPANLRRAGGAGVVVPVAVRQNDPNAIPINPQYLRRQFNEIPELWHSDIATANGRLETGSLDLPPAEAVREVFALGLDRSGVTNADEEFSSHQSWVPIVASLAIQGTAGPYWFLVRRTNDLGQLLAQLRRAKRLGSRFIEGRITECEHGVEAIRDGRQLERNDQFFESIISEIIEVDHQREQLLPSYERNRDHLRGLPDRYSNMLQGIADGDPVGTLLVELFNDAGIAIECLRYWSRMLSSCAMDSDDLPALVTMLAREDIAAEHTFARKAIRRIDFRLHGPSC
ncbi:hypothetical protein [Geobacter sp. DSM 2909]